MRLFRNVYPTSSIFPRLSLEKWQESEQRGAMKFVRAQTLELLNQPDFPQDQLEILKKGEYLISHQL